MTTQKIIVFMGPPGSGKGTQTKLLAKRLGYAYFSTGNLSREYAKQDSDLGRRIKSIIDAGVILPIEIIREIFTKKFETLNQAPGIILDGFPRTIEQAKLLEELMQKQGMQNLTALFLDVDREKLIGRISKRKTCAMCQAMYKHDMLEYQTEICSVCGGNLSVREDDRPEVIEKRFMEYLEKTDAVVKFYESQNVLIRINGDQTVEQVHEDIKKAVNL